MHQAGQVQYELEEKDNTDTLLHCYIPRDFTPKDVDLSYEVDGLSKGRIAIHFDTSNEGKLGCVELDGYVFPEGIEAKFNKKQSRYTFRLIRSGSSSAPSDADPDHPSSSSDHTQDLDHIQDLDSLDHFSDAASSARRSASPAEFLDIPDVDEATAAAAAAAIVTQGNISSNSSSNDSSKTKAGAKVQQGSGSAADDVRDKSANADQAAAAAASKSSSSKPDGDDGDADNDDDDEDEETAAEAAEGAVKKGKKRRGQRKRKKKKSKATENVSTETDTAATADTAAAAADQEEPEVFLDAISEGGDDVVASPADNQQQQQQQVSADSIGKQAAAAALPSPNNNSSSSRAVSAAPPPVVFNSDNYMDHFSDEPVAGTTVLPANASEVIQMPESLLQGPSVSHCLDTHVHKGEDKGMRVVGAQWTPAGSSVGTSFSAFGIFDGHGGKPAATYASKELLPNVMKLVDRCEEGSHSSPMSRQASAVPNSPAAPATTTDHAAEDADDGNTWGIEVTDKDTAVWAAQEALIDRLPKALFAGFLEADKICRQRHKTSGTTASLAIAVGWELFVANVGDSAAYLDTGKEVIAVSGNHRIDDNPAERARIIAAGGEVSKSCPDGVPVGPDRVWPGGLAMSRTIGDPHAPQVIAVPEIRHVTLPTTGGRLVIASDGVWDHMQPKGMIHQVRNENTEAAAKKLAYAALKKKGLKDDISVLVVDFTPAPGDIRPPALLPGPERDVIETCQVSRPLMEVEVAAAAAASSGESAESIAAALQKQASITSVAEFGSGHWKEVASARRSSALQLLRQQARLEAQLAAAEAARLAELAAKAAAETKSAGVSDTYRELAELRIDPNIIVAQVQAEQQQQQDAEELAAVAAAAEDGWEMVGGSSGAAGSGYVPFEQQLRLGGGRGRGRGRDHQHRRGRDAVSSPAAAAAAAGDNAPDNAAAAADANGNAHDEQQYHGGRASRGGRGFRGRGRSDRYERGSSSERLPGRGGRFGGRGHAPASRFAAEAEQQQQQQQHERFAAAAAAESAEGNHTKQQQQYFSGRGRGRGVADRGGFRGRGGRGSRGRGYYHPPAAAAAAEYDQQHFEHQADAAHAPSGRDDQYQQQQYRQRPQRKYYEYKPVTPTAAVAAAAGSSDAAPASDADLGAAANHAADVAMDKLKRAPAFKVVPRPGRNPPTPSTTTAAATADTTAAAANGSGSSSSSSCYKCQQPGHFARDCPQIAASDDSQGGTTGAAAAGGGGSYRGGRGGRRGGYNNRGGRGGRGGYDRQYQPVQQQAAV